jgi:hypothetical protein
MSGDAAHIRARHSEEPRGLAYWATKQSETMKLNIARFIKTDCFVPRRDTTLLKALVGADANMLDV